MVPPNSFGDDIRKFGTALKIIKRLEPLFAVIPVSAMLRMFRFSKVCVLAVYMRRLCCIHFINANAIYRSQSGIR